MTGATPDQQSSEGVLAAVLLTEYERQRQEQVNLGAQAAVAFLIAWDTAGPGAGPGTPDWSAWFKVVTELAEAYSEASWNLANVGYRRLQVLHDPLGEVFDLPRDRLNATALHGSMRSLVANRVGPGRSRTQLDQLRDRATPSFVRHLRAPGRVAVAEAAERAASPEPDRAVIPGRPSVRRDRRVLGWIRVTDGDPCSWCAMLASRAVFSDEGQRSLYRAWETALFSEEGKAYHDNCACTAIPVFSNRDPIPPQATWFREIWNDATSGYSGNDAVNSYRRSVEALRREHGSLEVAFAQRS